MRKKYLYICCTNDIYELPLIVEESGENLAKKMGISKSAVSHRIKNTNSRKNHCQKIFKIEV